LPRATPSISPGSTPTRRRRIIRRGSFSQPSPRRLAGSNRWAAPTIALMLAMPIAGDRIAIGAFSLELQPTSRSGAHSRLCPRNLWNAVENRIAVAAASSRCNLLCTYLSFLSGSRLLLRSGLISSKNTDRIRLKAIGFPRGHMTEPMICTLTDADAGCARMDPPARAIFNSGLRKPEFV
jgi:hypothetical protein